MCKITKNRRIESEKINITKLIDIIIFLRFKIFFPFFSIFIIYYSKHI